MKYLFSLSSKWITCKHLLLCLFLTDGWSSAPGSFIYSLRNKDDIASFKSTLVNENDTNAISRDSNSGPRFGYGTDLRIANNAGSNTDSFANFGHTYNLPPGYTTSHTNTRSLLGGIYHFTPSEVEVLYLN